MLNDVTELIDDQDHSDIDEEAEIIEVRIIPLLNKKYIKVGVDGGLWN